MPKISLAFKMIILFFGCSLASAQTFMGIEQSKSLKLQKYQAPAAPIKPMSSDDFKGAVGTMGEQTQNAISKEINKKLLPPPEPFTKAPPTSPNTQTTTTETTSTVVTTPQTQAPTTVTPAPSAPVMNNPVTAPPTSNMAPAGQTPASSTPVYSGFQGTENRGTSAPTSTPRGGSNTAPAKSSGWNINY